MSDLMAFLLARLDEDEADAEEAGGHGMRDCWAGFFESGSRVWGHIVRHDPDRVLADVQAKRAIVEGMQAFGPIDDINAPEVLGHLASVYSDHPDYRQEWKP